MHKYLAIVKALEKELNGQGVDFYYEQIPQSEHEEADLHSKLTTKELEQLPDEAHMEQVSHPSFEMPPLVMQLNIEPCWMDPYIEYLKTVKLSKDRLEARKIATKVANYPVLRGTLYKREKSTL